MPKTIAGLVPVGANPDSPSDSIVAHLTHKVGHGGKKEALSRPTHGEAGAGRCIRRAASASLTTPTVYVAMCHETKKGNVKYKRLILVKPRVHKRRRAGNPTVRRDIVVETLSGTTTRAEERG